MVILKFLSYFFLFKDFVVNKQIGLILFECSNYNGLKRNQKNNYSYGYYLVSAHFRSKAHSKEYTISSEIGSLYMFNDISTSFYLLSSYTWGSQILAHGTARHIFRGAPNSESITGRQLVDWKYTHHSFLGRNPLLYLFLSRVYTIQNFGLSRSFTRKPALGANVNLKWKLNSNVVFKDI